MTTDSGHSADLLIRDKIYIARRRFPGFDVKTKRSSVFIMALYYVSFMWIWNREFLDNFTTTIGRTIYVGEPLAGPGGLALLCHELVHVEDSKGFGTFLWSTMYLFPQCLAVLAVLAFVSKWFLLCLVFLAPWPAPFRVWAEARGYEKTIETFKEFRLELGEADLEWLKKMFCGWAYYRMCWRWKPLETKFRKLISGA